MINREDIRNLVLERVDITRDISTEELMDVIDTVITDECVGEYISLKDRVGLRQEIYDSIKGMDILDSILQDENSGITEIMINGPDNIFVEKNGRI